MSRQHTKKSLIEFETRVKETWEAGKIKCPVHLCGGNEEELLKIFDDVLEGDYVVSTHRNHYHALLSGIEEDWLFNKIVNNKEGGSMVVNHPQKRFYSTALVGGGCALACGLGQALMDKLEYVWCFVGDGALDTGHFWESYRYVVGRNLPVMFVVEDNNRSTCSSLEDRLGLRSCLWPLSKYDSLPQLIYYAYEPTYPHVGSGKYVAF